MSNNPTPPVSSLEKPPKPLRRILWWTFWIVLAASAVLYFPKEVSYWCLAAAEKASQDGQTDEALRWIDRAARFNSGEVRVHVMRAQALLRDGQVDKALAAIDKALARHDSEGLRNVRLSLLLQLGREREAIDEILRRGGSSDASLERRLALAQSLSILDRNQEAIELLAAAKSSDPKQQAAIHLQRAQIYKDMAKFDEALTEIEAAKGLQPHSEIAFQQAEILLHLGRFDDAASICTALEKEASFVTRQTNAGFNNNLAYFRAVAGKDLDSAKSQAESAVRLTSGAEPSYLDTRGFVSYRQGEHEKALADFETAVSRFQEMLGAKTSSPDADRLNRVAELAQEKMNNRTLGVLYYHRSLALEALGKTAEAEADRAKVRELGFEPDDRLF